MFELRCQFCGRTNIVPNVLKCPYCNKDMSNYTDELSKKHIRKCAYYLSPYQYGKHKPGRPRKEDAMRELFGAD